MYLLKKRFSDRVYIVGIVMILISLLSFCIPFFTGLDEDGHIGLFITNFLLTAVYFIYRKVEKYRVNAESKLYHLFLLLILFFISAWALNREMNILESSVNWFSALMVSLCVFYGSAAFIDTSRTWVGHLSGFVNGVGFITFLYLASYLFPFYIIGLFGSILIGISLHVFVPLLFVIYISVFQSRISRNNNQYWWSFAAGIAVVLAITIQFASGWSSMTSTINRAYNTGLKSKSDLPAWVNVAERMPVSSLADKVLKARYVYTVANEGQSVMGSFFWGDTPWRNLGEPVRHDPLVMIGSFFSERIIMDEDMRTRILESSFDRHHELEERLWSGDNLKTDHVNTEVKLWPQCNIAYTEKTINVRHADSERGSWRRQGEALYTFYMPEGSVVTSLSLWVNGKEEKAALTTKALADSAYKTIVGVERRDPSVVHWREGNTVSVRVFPVITGETRQFKIGITSPMERIDGSLRYRDIWFKGPSGARATEELQVHFEQPVRDFKLPASFASQGQQIYKRKGRYTPGWSLQINDPGLEGCSFNFGGYDYSLSPYHKKLSQVSFSTIYLDINQAWTREEFDGVINAAGNRKIFVFDETIIPLSSANSNQLWEKLHSQSFSLFPVYEITDKEHSLLVTKTSRFSFHLDDLEGSAFMDKLKKFLSEDGKVNVYNLGDELSVYLRTLKEFRAFRFDDGDAAMLAHHLQKEQFPEDIESDNLAVIHSADMVVEKTTGSKLVSGPDHVMRLFAYNHIMQRLGKGLLTKRPIDDTLVQEARKAYVVTPVSSLVVLETQKDYDRFGIANSEAGTLANASMYSKGAVPEPHEWALIILVAGVMVYVIRKRRLQHTA
jgi:XrtN system VIT domain protein